MTKAQFIRWANARERARNDLTDALTEMRRMGEVTDAATPTTEGGKTAPLYVRDAMGCVEGAIALLTNAYGEMEHEPAAPPPKGDTPGETPGEGGKR